MRYKRNTEGNRKGLRPLFVPGSNSARAPGLEPEISIMSPEFEQDSTLHQRVLFMKLLSERFSLIGAFVFSVTIGMAILWILDRHR